MSASKEVTIPLASIGYVTANGVTVLRQAGFQIRADAEEHLKLKVALVKGGGSDVAGQSNEPFIVCGQRWTPPAGQQQFHVFPKARGQCLPSSGRPPWPVPSSLL